jgi:inhibitor of KinA
VEGIVAQLGNEEPPAPRLVEIPVCYGGVYGPDLEAVARHTGLPPQELIRRHAAGSYRVYMLGFAPGFAYLGGMDEQLATPRKAEPRTAIPAGSVGIAGGQTGVYPLETPGGWQLIGRTPLPLFDAQRNPPSLLQMGNRVRFVPIDEATYLKLERRQHGT